MLNENAFLTKVRMEAHPKGAGNVAWGILYQFDAKSMLNASWWYFVGPPPAEGGRRPRAQAAASPQGWPPPKTSPSIQKVFDCKWY
jgi:hypothetical protein